MSIEFAALIVGVILIIAELLLLVTSCELNNKLSIILLLLAIIGILSLPIIGIPLNSKINNSNKIDKELLKTKTYSIECINDNKIYYNNKTIDINKINKLNKNTKENKNSIIINTYNIKKSYKKFKITFTKTEFNQKEYIAYIDVKKIDKAK